MMSPKFTHMASRLRRWRKPMAVSFASCFLTFGTVAKAGSDATPAAPGAGSNEPGAAPRKEQCVDWHKQAQLAQNELRLVEARQLAKLCAAEACPGLIVNDCARWFNDLDLRLPSVVFEVRVDGEPDTTATVTSDGKRVDEWTRGEALRLDPGEHQFKAELGDYAPIVRKVLLAEGMRFRVITIDFKSASLQKAPSTPPAVVAPEPAQPQARRLSPLFIPLLAAGGVGLGGFGVFALVGKSKQHNLENTCRPNCTQDDLGGMKTAYLLGDISLGIGVASLVAAGVFYLRAGSSATPASVGFVRLPGGAAASATYRF